MKTTIRKYRTGSIRASFWDYRWNAAYFLTFNTKHHVPYFGEIQNGIMCLNEIGSIAHREWLKTPTMRPDMNIQLGAFVVMPNHIHGIITIGKNQYNSDQSENSKTAALQCGTRGSDQSENSETAALQCGAKNSFGPQSKNIPSIIGGIKTAITIKARKINPEFKWQPRYHDIIIRDERAYNNISKYIIHNPSNWRKK